MLEDTPYWLGGPSVSSPIFISIPIVISLVNLVNGAIGGFVGGATLVLEPSGRQAEIALFCVNKTLETLYHMALRRKLPVRIPYGECLLAGLAIGLICFHYVNCP